MKIIDAHKGMNEYTVHFGGLAGHSSKPHLGVNAAEYATRYVGKLLEIREELKKEFKKIVFLILHIQLYQLVELKVVLLIMSLQINVVLNGKQDQLLKKMGNLLRMKLINMQTMYSYQK